MCNVSWRENNSRFPVPGIVHHKVGDVGVVVETTQFSFYVIFNEDISYFNYNNTDNSSTKYMKQSDYIKQQRENKLKRILR